MKILRIRLNNLNSIKGPYLIDLTKEPLASAGLFAITGPTGAGKSTILDAITLALYGKAARYGSEANPEDMMSRHAGECSAEVEFEVPSGVYRAVWERRRAQNRADGKLQPPKRYIYDAAGETLAQQIREADEKIEELLGLNYDRFLRSVLLAQGDFAKFLKANANERAELLESLTGTAIYTRLGKLAYDGAIERAKALADRKVHLGQIVILEDEARKELEGAIQQGDEERKRLDAEIKKGGEMLSKISELEKARTDEMAAAVELDEIEKKRKHAEVDLERLRQHRLTVPFAAELALLDAAKIAMTTSEGNRLNAEADYGKTKKALVKANLILGASIRNALTKRQREMESGAEAVEKESQIAKDTREWLNKHEADAGLVNRIGDLTAAIGDLKNARGAVRDGWSDWTRTAVEIMPNDVGVFPDSLEATSHADLEQMLENFFSVAAKSKQELKTTEEDAKKQRDLRQDHLAKAMQVATFEDHRANLKEGEACSLCGALEHPYAEGSVPSDEIGELEDEVKKAIRKFDEANKNHLKFDGTLSKLNSQRGKILVSVREASDFQSELEKLLKPLGVPIPVCGDEDALRKKLQIRESDYLKRVKDEGDAIHRKDAAEKTVTAAKNDAVTLEQKLLKVPALPADLQLGPIDLKELLPVSEAEENYTAAEKGEGIKAAQLVDRQKDERKAVEVYDRIKLSLESSVAGSEFNTLEELCSAQLALNVAIIIEELDKTLTNRKIAANALLQKAKGSSVRLLAEKVVEGDEAKLVKDYQVTLKDESHKLVEDQVARRNAIIADDINREKWLQGQKELQEDQKSLAIWNRLKELIGSADGSKFRRHAQGISLDVLTRKANRHLESLSDRYRICRDDAETLNLQIEDLHQAGVRRPMASLSGGESFLASLALALGLSDLAGRKVRIDSLFIDEGFGSLDSETLEIAIVALESLRQDQKTVGVISHVSVLQQRIGTQIVVEKNPSGVSRIRVIP